MGKYKPWYFIPNQSRFDAARFSLRTSENECKQFTKLAKHNEKQMRRKRIKKK